jgi:ATP-binding cassette, subfamily B, multidrug efflux pump
MTSQRATAQLAPPEEETQRESGTDLKLLMRLFRFTGAKELALFAVALVLMTPVIAGATLVQPLLIRDAINAAILTRSNEALLGTVHLFLIAITVEFVAGFIQVYTLQLAGQRALAKLRLATFAKVQRLHTSYFDRTPVGRVVTRVTNDVDSLGELFASGAVMAVADIVTLIGIVGFMLYLDWRLSLVALVAIPPLALVINGFRRFAREAFRSIRTRIAQLNAYLAEQVQGAAVVQAFGREAECQNEYRGINAAHRDANHRSIKYDALLYSIVESVSAVTIALVLWYAAYRAFDLPRDESAMWVGTVVAFYEYIQRFFVPIRDLSQKYTIIQSSLAAAERIYEVLDRKDEDAPEDGVHQTKPETGDTVIEMQGVRFGYRKDQEVLHGIDLKVRRGEKIAIVGATGAGKTTVTALLLRLYDIQAGRVLAFGADVREQKRDELRSRFAVVSQDVFLFTGTVLENIALGDVAPDRERAQRALEQVGAWDLLQRREGGLDTKVDERGSNFSQGERQLLSFARAIYLDREILVLDEATASIDSETEARLQRAVATVLEGRTAIVIAHRLSTIRAADRILVFHKGKIAEEGRHDALVAKNGIYARLVRLQFAEAAGAAA